MRNLSQYPLKPSEVLDAVAGAEEKMAAENRIGDIRPYALRVAKAMLEQSFMGRVTDQHLHRMAVKVHGPTINRWRYSKDERKVERTKMVETTWQVLTPAERRGIMQLCLQELALMEKK